MDARKSIAVLLLALVSLAAHASPPYKYYLLAPEQLSTDLTVMSLEPGNTISVGTRQVPLGEYARAVIPAAELVPGRILSGTARYVLGSNGNATGSGIFDPYHLPAHAGYVCGRCPRGLRAGRTPAAHCMSTSHKEPS